MALVLAIDLGTTNLKVGLIDEKGEILSSYTSEITTHSKETGEAEHDPEQLKKLIIEQCKKVLKECNRDDVQYVISSTYHFGLMMLDNQRKPITGITLLTDTRAQQTFTDFVFAFSNEDLYHQTGCPLISQYALPRLYFFSKAKQEIFSKAKYFHDSKSFLFEWLTGELVTDISTASASQLFNIQRFQWDQNILSKINLSADQFPSILDGTKNIAPIRKEIAEVLGLNRKVQVVLGVYDGAVLGLGLSGLSQENAIVNIGTTAMMRIPSNQPVFDKNENRRIQAYALNNKTFLNGGALNNAALALNWMHSNLFEFDIQNQELHQTSNDPPLFALPYLTGERDSLTGPFASGSFFGIRRNHTRIDFVRSILDGVAYSLRSIGDALKENNLQFKEICMGGGGVNITPWPQIFANVLGVPVRLPEIKEISLVGNAILAFTAGGFYNTIGEAGKLMHKPGKIIEPVEEAVNIHNRRYEFFKKLRDQLGYLYQEHMELRSLK